MERNWTDEQKEVILHRNGNLLVSAGAGAGKTAVLVERILGRILDEDRPIGLNELLVVTFTRASAAEMKERIGLALEEKLSLAMEGRDEALMKRLSEQYALLPQAEISTIDSFCKSVIMENFQKTELDPAFRIADESELLMLKMELMEDFLERQFEKGETDFLNTVRFFERGKSDGKLEELLFDLLTVSESFPNSEKWFTDRIEELQGSLFEEERMSVFLDFIKKRLLSVKSMNDRALALIYEKGGALQYEEALLSDKETIDSLLASESMEALFAIFSELKFAVLKRGKPKDAAGKPIEVDEDLKNKTKNLRDGYKAFLTKKLKERYFYDSVRNIEEEYEVIKRVLTKLLQLAAAFREDYQRLKRKKNMVDFSDLSHIALRLLLDDENKPTEIAREYRETFAEIMIDEYQDSNLIQDLLLTAISREETGEPNLFMVGDVKQSIYGFRQAEPAIFLEKYETYRENGAYRKISLFKNFRSKKAVIDTVNTVFRRLMQKELGGIVYDDRAALALGRADDSEILEKNKTEILLFDEELSAEDDETASDISLREKEAYMIGTRIKDLIREGWSFGDITILLRSMTGWDEEFKAVLSSMEIPVVSETTTGYFSAWEVQVMLAFLSVIDNPRQDIPLAAVLLSPIGGFDESELSEMRVNAPEERTLWDVLLKAETEKGRAFLKMLATKRKEAVYLPVHELIGLIYEETSFYHYVLGMKGGEVRIANLDMLITKAKEFEESSLYGLHSFVRYIEKLRKYNRDFGEAFLADTTDAVRIMSIHKSKGLEFPVVFVSGLSKGFNKMDSMKTVVIHKELGLAADYFNIETREEGKSFFKSLISDKIRLESLSEEIRILYVALTRAKEKLILTGEIKNASEKLAIYKEEAKESSPEEEFSRIVDSASFMDLLLPTLLIEDADFVKEPEIFGMKDIYVREGEDVFDKKRFIGELFQTLESEFTSIEEREAYRQIEKEAGFLYPYAEAVRMKPSMTVTELKRLFLSERDGMEEASFLKEKEEEEKGLLSGFITTVPKFLLEESTEREEVSGTERGSLVHRFLKKMDFLKDYTKEEIKSIVEELDFQGIIGELDRNALYYFTKSTLFRRMREASFRNELFRETPFTVGIEKKVGDTTEMVVVQGIIDAWFFENGEPVLVDYKTDRVKREGGAELLKRRYMEQLLYYGEALKRITGKPVKERLLYSLYLSEIIEIEKEEDGCGFL